jgi:hypothetical protein
MSASTHIRPPSNVVPVSGQLTLHTRPDETGQTERMADEVSVLAIGWNEVGGFLYLVFDRLSPQAPRWIPQERVERLHEHLVPTARRPRT